MLSLCFASCSDDLILFLFQEDWLINDIICVLEHENVELVLDSVINEKYCFLYVLGLHCRWLIIIQCTVVGAVGGRYFLFTQLRQTGYTPQVRCDWVSNLWPLNHKLSSYMYFMDTLDLWAFRDFMFEFQQMLFTSVLHQNVYGLDLWGLRFHPHQICAFKIENGTLVLNHTITEEIYNHSFFHCAINPLSTR